MEIQYCSDLHLEFYQNKSWLKQKPLEAVGKILLLAGDIMLLAQIKENEDFFSWCADSFEATYWIPGNHEYYHYDLATKPIPLLEKIKENVFLVNNQTIPYKNVELICSTLWSHIPLLQEWTVESSVSDFELIKNNGKKLTAAAFNALHKADFEFIQQALAIPTDKQRIVMTHHVPTLMHYPPQYITSKINGAFANELYSFIESCDANYWIYGHHHCNIPAFSIGSTELLTNQLGYVQQGEHGLFNPKAIIEI